MKCSLNRYTRCSKPNRRLFESLESRRVLAAVPFSDQIIIDDLDNNGASVAVVADLDGDDDMDVVVGSGFELLLQGRLAWYENLGDGQFSHHVVADELDDVRAILAEDFDGDGDTDLVAGIYGSDEVVYFENLNGKGEFSVRSLSSTANGVRALAAGDIDKDGDLDIVSASYLNDRVSWHENLGEGLFALSQNISTSAMDPVSVKIADVDGDSNVDVVVAFKRDDSISWFAGSGDGAFGPGNDIQSAIDGPEEIAVGDLDGDGDVDIATAVWDGNQIVWHENNGDGTFANQHILTNGSQMGTSVDIVDLDGDGDLDVISSTFRINDSDNSEDKVSWFDNTDGNGTFKREQFIAFNSTAGVRTVIAADLDTDGDSDVVSVSQFDNKISWYQNDGSARFGRQLSIASDASAAASVEVVDINGDGHLDVLAGAYSDNGASWYEGNGTGIFSKEKVITNSALQLQKAIAGDIDGDGDADVLSASSGDDKIAWYENLNGSGEFGAEKVITRFANGAVDVRVADLDGDDDLDVLTASYVDATFAWYENIDGKGTFSDINVLARPQLGAEWIYPQDIDGDGDLDVLGAGYGTPESDAGKVVWFENTDSQGSFSTARTIHQGNSPTSVRAIDIDGDQDQDIVIALNGNSTLIWYENMNGSFANPETIAFALLRVEALEIADIDGNGTEDIVTAGTNSVVWIERTLGGFQQHTLSTSGDVSGVFNLHVEDIDGDGDQDVFAASVYDSKISWYRNESSGGVKGDFDLDGNVDVDDINLLCGAIHGRQQDENFDLNADQLVDQSDLDHLVVNILGTSRGDANLDGIFNSRDLVEVFQHGQYEDGIANNSSWASGDWNCDGEFTTRDLVDSFIAGGYDDAAVSTELATPSWQRTLVGAAILKHEMAGTDGLRSARAL